MALNRYRTRTILNSTETTADTVSLNGSALSFVFQDSDSFYVGFEHRFASRYFKMETANTNAATLSVEYWDGSAWQAVEDLIDQTNGMTQSGFIGWQNLKDWKSNELTPVDDKKLYWVRIQTDTTFSAGTELEAVVNLFSDDNDLRGYYPEIANDTRFFPSGRTDFLEQHRLAKEDVIRRLMQRNTIKHEGQIIDINAVNAAAVHACAYNILAPIATSEAMIQLRDQAKQRFDEEISELSLKVDTDDDGTLSEVERREDVTQIKVVRR